MQTELARLFDDVPDELIAYFERLGEAPLPDLLDARAAVDLTLEFREFIPVLQALSGVILDDENTSNHHVYLVQPPLTGMVLYLPHDDAPRVVFPWLAAYLAAVREAQECEGWITDFHPAEAPLAADQVAMGALITGLLEDYNEDDTGMILTALIPSLDLSDVGLLSRLAAHEDFYLAEAVANEITRRPSRGLTAVAEICASHPHPQAAAAGARAVQTIAAAA